MNNKDEIKVSSLDQFFLELKKRSDENFVKIKQMYKVGSTDSKKSGRGIVNDKKTFQ